MNIEKITENINFCGTEIMKTFIAQNGKEVAKLVTPSGVTVYVDTSIPLEAMEGLKQKLSKKIAARQAINRFRTNHYTFSAW